ncbi:hypothetical protein JCM3765_002820 [Sporobolomyces pararoseus]
MYLPRSPRIHQASSTTPSSSSNQSRVHSNILSSSQASQLSRSTQLTIPSPAKLYQTPSRIVKPPSSTSGAIDKYSRRPRVRFTSTTTGETRKRSCDSVEKEWFEDEDAVVESDSDHGAGSRVDDELQSLFPDPAFTRSDPRQFRLSSRARYLGLLEPTLAELKTGPLATVPIVDLEVFSQVYATAGSRAINAVAFSDECTAAFEAALLEDKERTAKTRAILASVQAQISEGGKVERHNELENLVKKLSLVNSKLLQNHHSASQEILELKSLISAQLSFVAHQWQAAAVQYRAAFVNASRISSPPPKPSRGGSPLDSRSAKSRTSSRANNASAGGAQKRSTRNRGKGGGQRR